MTDIAAVKGRLRDAEAKADENLQSKHALYCAAAPFCATRYSDAVRVKGTGLLEHNLNEGHWPGGRTNYEIDRDQVLFHSEFVRLARKTQVFIGQRNVVYRNRLMHTLEVVQLARSVAHKNGLNVDLAEAIAYGHDIGHTPFGHAGEAALNLCLYEYFIRRCLGVDERPYLGRFGGSRNNEQARFDNALWFVVERLAMKKPGGRDGLIEESLVKELLGGTVFSRLCSQKIVRTHTGTASLNDPLQWEGWSEGRRLLQQEFWVQDGNAEIFAHYIHGLRVLLCCKRRLHADVTRQTAYGILSHSWRKEFEQFKAVGPGFSIEFGHEDDTAEAFVVRQADDICFTNSDVNDALAAKIWDWSCADFQNEKKKLICALSGPETDTIFQPSPSKRLEYCEQHFEFESPGYGGSQYSFAEKIEAVQELIRKDVHPVLLPREESAKRIVRELFWFYCGGPSAEDGSKVRDVDKRAWDAFMDTAEGWPEDSTPHSVRLVTDYIASLTDDEAIGIHEALFSPEQAPWEQFFV